MENLVDAIRHLLLGYTEEEKAERKKQLEEAQKQVEENKERNGGTYNPVDEIFKGMTDEVRSVGIVALSVVVLVWVFKD